MIPVGEKTHMKFFVPVVFTLVIVLSVAYFSVSNVDQNKPSSGCKEIGPAKINSLVKTFMADEGHANYTVQNVSPIYCSFGVSTYNVNSDVLVRPGEPLQSTRNLRLQIRSDSEGTRVYEVLLSNPSKDLLR
jgi:hypothetical protein